MVAYLDVAAYITPPMIDMAACTTPAMVAYLDMAACTCITPAMVCLS